MVSFALLDGSMLSRPTLAQPPTFAFLLRVLLTLATPGSSSAVEFLVKSQRHRASEHFSSGVHRMLMVGSAR